MAFSCMSYDENEYFCAQNKYNVQSLCKTEVWSPLPTIRARR